MICEHMQFSALTPAESERLAILAEECAEVIQAVGKILRHGYESHNPFDTQRVTNRGRLAQEIGHVTHVIHRMIDARDLSAAVIRQSMGIKAEGIAKYLHHQD